MSPAVLSRQCSGTDAGEAGEDVASGAERAVADAELGAGADADEDAETEDADAGGREAVIGAGCRGVFAPPLRSRSHRVAMPSRRPRRTGASYGRTRCLARTAPASHRLLTVAPHGR
ncbi:hypothetical protein AN218_32680 [Streptomyces nanshensis]|uniref:Uncharacterized protein n=1 Tax=Streptomyces nanshensis TaxID=518642 RepID=A0A1E7KH89_9ACTN|nr:hypothetical protein AN218_32680 [Streptomyces nanshensis]